MTKEIEGRQVSTGEKFVITPVTYNGEQHTAGVRTTLAVEVAFKSPVVF
jgi:hypothetical protein